MNTICEKVAPMAQHMAMSLRLTGTYPVNLRLRPTGWLLSRQLAKRAPNGEPKPHRYVLRQRRFVGLSWQDDAVTI